MNFYEESDTDNDYVDEPWPDKPEEAKVWDPSTREWHAPGTPVGLGATGQEYGPAGTYGEGNPLDTGIYYQGDGETNHRPWSTILFVLYNIGFALYLIGMVVIIFLLSQMSSWMQQMGVSEKYTSTFAQSVPVFLFFLILGFLFYAGWIVLWRIGMKRADDGRLVWLKVMSIIGMVFASISFMANLTTVVLSLFGGQSDTMGGQAGTSISFAFSSFILYLYIMVVKNLFKENETAKQTITVDSVTTGGW